MRTDELPALAAEDGGRIFLVELEGSLVGVLAEPVE